MSPFVKRCMSVSAVIIIAACSGAELEDSRGLDASGSPFQDTGYAGYINRAEHEYGYGHYVSSDAFAVKARSALAGETIGPWEINGGIQPRGNVSDELLPEITEARDSLVAMLDSPAPQTFAEEAATALIMFDCWLEEESYVGDWREDDQPDHAAECRDGFYAAMAQIKMEPEPEPAPAPAPAPVTLTEQSVLVFFDWDSSELSPEAMTILQAAADARANDNMQIMGHADTSGTNAYNMALSERRAAAVATALTGLGVSSSGMGLSWFGESEPLVETGDGIREPQNRRVQVVFESGS